MTPARERPLVLLVDDEEVFLEIASTKLKTEGFLTVVAYTVTDALTKAEELLPDLILSDVYMPPGPNGWEFALEIRRNPKTRNIRFAFFTSLRDPWAELKKEHASAAQELGRVTFFSKMDDVDHLADLVGKLIAEAPA